MLIDILEKVLEAFEGGKDAAILLGVDYEKAFNRMEHAVCFERLEQLGASRGSISLVAAFLEGRKMTITIGEFMADPVGIIRGSPQGSVLGCLIYCITTQLLTIGLRQEHRVGDAAKVEDQSAAFLYVDNTALFYRVPMSRAVRHCTTTKTTEEFQDLALTGDFDVLTERAVEIGMAINEKKTQLLVISPTNGCRTTAVMATRTGGSVSSVDEMKLVGFTVGSSPGAGARVVALEEKCKRKKRMLYHLRDAGFRGPQLFKLYCCYVRSVFEYCSPVYHTMLTQG